MTSTPSLEKSLEGLRVPSQRTTPSGPRPVAARRSSLAFLPVIALGVDTVALIVAVVLATVSRDHIAFLPASATDFRPRALLATPIILAGWLALIAVVGGYRSGVIGSGSDEYRRVTNSAFLYAASITLVCFFLKFQLSRSFVGLLAVAGPLLLILGRMMLRVALERMRRKGAFNRRVLVVGSGPHVDEVSRVLMRERARGFEIIGALTNTASTERTGSGVPVLGRSSDTLKIAEEIRPEVIVFAGGAVDSAAKMREIAWELEDSSISLMVAPSVTDVSRERISFAPVGGLPLLNLEKPRAAAAAKRAKRVFDLVGSAFLLVLFAPVFAFLTYKVWRFDRGPILFKQERIGRHGEPFMCWKFRTMATNAESRLAELVAEQEMEHGVFVKLKVDPRITKPGRWLRKLSLDELPQLVNVFRGDMSLVGPRPQVQDEVDQYDDAMSRRLHVRPGMTGLWQVSGRSDLSLEEAIRLDLYYVDNWSMVQDLSILSRTVSAVVASKGAY